VHQPDFNEGNVTDKPPWVQNLTVLDPAVQDGWRRNAYRTLLAVDDLVEGVFGALEDKGVLDRTVVVFMTDNGYAFGEHRWEDKRCPYDECGHTPLLVRYPGRAGRIVSALADNVDIAPTLADIAGVTPSIPLDGVSLLPIITGAATSVQDEVLLHWVGGNARGIPGAGRTFVPGYWGIRDAHYKYIEYATGDIELYNMKADPWELRNRAGDATFVDIQADLAARLHAIIDPLLAEAGGARAGARAH
jgi:arylsulfatase A-like enzyme